MIQTLIALLLGGIFALAADFWQGLSALYGGFISITTAFFLSRGVRRAEATALTNPKASLGILYLGAVFRFALVVVLFVLGLMLLDLDPLATAAGFILVQLGHVLNLRGLGSKAA